MDRETIYPNLNIRTIFLIVNISMFNYVNIIIITVRVWSVWIMGLPAIC